MVPELVEVFKDEDYYHLVMELCQCLLKDVLLKKKRLNEHEAVIVIKHVTNAVHKMHRRGIAHRDIKPGNILLGFGKSLFGNRYRAPEMSSLDRVYDERVDVWSVGIVLYEMLSGKCAFPKLASREIEKRLRCLKDLLMSSFN
ncbi:calcium-dependent protein kinase 29-like [Selaginella moellendorffii]|uniref:calcium-dependent protein kinase 29-like n=1 Tax=Selaginella moellendorffii TaxID=88036 RepID=UPI000D1CB2D1|nr:calcium-dependent protein kinase 29-like [Selaginella moellendorffii]|eukprot:XP_024516863.1 calcium-dependent protein kinase 29-like [Selaginella moellendorffii]